MTDRPNLTPKPWPEFQWPSAAEWRDWFLAQDAAGQQWLAERILEDAEAASSCRIDGHDGLLAQIQAHRCITDDDLSDRLATEQGRANRYRLAWLSVRRYRRRGRQLARILADTLTKEQA